MERNSYIETATIDFARKYKSIVAVSAGTDPEDIRDRVYYFIVNDQSNPERSDAISEIESTLFIQTRIIFNFSEWPCDDVDKAVKNNRFLGQIIWRRKQS